MPRIAILLLALVTALPASAQEVQVPLDQAGRLMVIDRSHGEADELFPEYPGFLEARLFRISGQEFALEILYEEDGETLRRRRTMSPDEVEALRVRVATILDPDVRAGTKLDQSGRAQLLGQAAVASLLLYGPALPVAFDVDSEQAAAALYLATTSAGFFIPYFLTMKAPVSQGAATLSRVGTWQGAIHGLSLSYLIGGSSTSGRAAYGITALGSALESYLGYRIATNRRLSRGTAETIGVGGLYGGVLGLSLAGIVVAAEEDFLDHGAELFGGGTLVGSLGGAFAGYWLTGQEPYTRGDARVLNAAGLLGVNAGILGIVLTDTNDGSLGSGMIAAGTVAGLAAGRLLTTNRDFTAAQGSFVGLATAAGGLAGFAVAAILDAAARPTYALGTAGAMTGFGLMYAAFADDARRASNSPDLGQIRMEIDVNAVGLAGLAGGKVPTGTGMFRLAMSW